MANTFTKTVSGKLCYVDPTNLADDTVITTSNTEFTHISSYPVGGDFIKKTQDGIACILPPPSTTYEFDSGLGIQYNFGTKKEIFIQALIKRQTTNSQLIFGRKNPASGNLFLFLWDIIHAWTTWDINGHLQYGPAFGIRGAINFGWYLCQSHLKYISTTEVEAEHYIYEVSTGKVVVHTKIKKNYLGNDYFGNAATDLWKFTFDTR